MNVEPKVDTAVARFNDLIAYLGQLEFNITNVSDSLESMLKEKTETINLLRELEHQIRMSVETSPE